METVLRILILEDSEDDANLIEHQLSKDGVQFTSRVVETREAYENALTEFEADVIISDHSLPQFDSLAALQMFRSYKKIYNPAAAFILVTGTVSEEFAVQIMKSGADDYILKDRLKRLPAAVRNAVEKNRIIDLRRKEEEEKLYLFDILQRSLHETYVIDPETKFFEYVNEAALANLGYTRIEFLSLTPGDVISEYSEARFRETLNYAGSSTKGTIFERYAVRKNGTKYPIQVHLQLIEQGRKQKILANVLDITEAKVLEQQKQLATNIQNCFSHSRDLHDSLDRVLEKLSSTCGCLAAEIYVREYKQRSPKCFGIYNPWITEPSETGFALAEKTFETPEERTVYADLKNLDRSGEEEWFAKASVSDALGIPVKLGSEVVAVLIFFGSEMERADSFRLLSEPVLSKLAENIERKKKEEELQKIFEFSPDILVIVGKDGFVRKVNPALEKILGYTAEEVLNLNYFELIHPDDHPVLQEWLQKEVREDEVGHYESRIRTRTGEYKWFAWSITPYLKGKLSFAVGKDITELKNHIEAVNAQNKRLAEIAWEQSHVVRAPLTRLLACVEFLEENQEDPDGVLATVKTSAYEIDHIIRRIINKSEKVESYGDS